MKRLVPVVLSCGLLIQAAWPQSQTAPLETLTGIQDRLACSDLAGARAQLDPVLRQYPADGRLHNLQGIIAGRLNDYASAEAEFRNAVRLSPGLSGGWLKLGRLYQTNLDRDPKAARKGMEVYRRILSAPPDLPEANYQLALVVVLRTIEVRPY